MGWILLFIVIFIIYKLVIPKKPKAPNSFDAYLIDHHKKSLAEAEKIPVVVPSQKDIKPLRKNRWVDDLYLGMIKSGQYDTPSLRKEAMEAMKITESELNEMLEQYELNNKKKR